MNGVFVEQRVGDQVYWIVRDEMFACVVELRKRDGSWKRIFSFDTVPQLPIDFACVHYWCETHPSSAFLRGLSVFLPLADGSSRTIDMEVA